MMHEKRQAESFLNNRAVWAESPKELAKLVDVTFLSLPGPSEVKGVAEGHEGLVEGMNPGSVVFDLSTNSPTVVRNLHSEFAKKRLSYTGCTS
jgi:3-hydroxyisobutyrate dehydrogenase